MTSCPIWDSGLPRKGRPAASSYSTRLRNGPLHRCRRASGRGYSYFGVEIDRVSAQVAQVLHPTDTIVNASLDECYISHDSFDAVMGNVPYSDAIQLKTADGRTAPIHDCFIMESIDALRPGGVAALLTSRFTMDKQSETTRRWIAQRAELIGAVRLPAETFRSQAGTDVVSDVLLFRKRDKPTASIDDCPWVRTTGLPAPDGSTVTVATIFSDGSHVIGSQRIALGRLGYAIDVASGMTDKEIGRLMAEELRGRTVGFGDLRSRLGKRSEHPCAAARPKSGNDLYEYFADENGTIWYGNGEIVEAVPLPDPDRIRLGDMIHLRDHARDLLAFERSCPDDEAVATQIAKPAMSTTHSRRGTAGCTIPRTRGSGASRDGLQLPGVSHGCGGPRFLGQVPGKATSSRRGSEAANRARSRQDRERARRPHALPGQARQGGHETDSRSRGRDRGGVRGATRRGDRDRPGHRRGGARRRLSVRGRALQDRRRGRHARRDHRRARQEHAGAMAGRTGPDRDRERDRGHGGPRVRERVNVRGGAWTAFCDPLSATVAVDVDAACRAEGLSRWGNFDTRSAIALLADLRPGCNLMADGEASYLWGAATRALQYGRSEGVTNAIYLLREAAGAPRDVVSDDAFMYMLAHGRILDDDTLRRLFRETVPEGIAIPTQSDVNRMRHPDDEVGRTASAQLEAFAEALRSDTDILDYALLISHKRDVERREEAGASGGSYYVRMRDRDLRADRGEFVGSKRATPHSTRRMASRRTLGGSRS